MADSSNLAELRVVLSSKKRKRQTTTMRRWQHLGIEDGVDDWVVDDGGLGHEDGHGGGGPVAVRRRRRALQRADDLVQGQRGVRPPRGHERGGHGRDQQRHAQLRLAQLRHRHRTRVHPRADLRHLRSPRNRIIRVFGILRSVALGWN